MASAREKKNAPSGQVNKPGNTAPDDFPEELRGEFEQIPSQLAANIGAIAALAVAGGGYFGISVPDDGGSCRLAIRHKSFELDRRFSGIGKLEGALAYCLQKLRSAE